jgi:hypothetical protein
MKKIMVFVAVLTMVAFVFGAIGVGPAKTAERHPEIYKAIKQLKGARQDLEKAAHDYCGHRVAAIQSIDQALHELDEALKCDKK